MIFEEKERQKALTLARSAVYRKRQKQTSQQRHVKLSQYMFEPLLRNLFIVRENETKNLWLRNYFQFQQCKSQLQ